MRASRLQHDRQSRCSGVFGNAGTKSGPLPPRATCISCGSHPGTWGYLCLTMGSSIGASGVRRSSASLTVVIASRRSTVARISSSEPTCEELHKRNSCDEIAAERARDSDSALYSEAAFGTNGSRNAGLGTWTSWPTNLSSLTALSGHALSDMEGTKCQGRARCYEA